MDSDKKIGGTTSDKKTDKLITIGKQAHLFLTEDRTPFATIERNGVLENYPINSSEFRNWLHYLYFKEYGDAALSARIESAVSVFSATALHEGKVESVFIRVGNLGGTLFIDLANDKREVVAVTGSDWTIITTPPVKFIRPRGMLSLPKPDRVAGVDGVANLRKFINIPSDDNFKLLLGWIISAFHPTGPYLLLANFGERGSAKSTAARIVRLLIDPVSDHCLLKVPPRNVDDLMVTAKNNWIVTIDNLSEIKASLSDTLCSISTGGSLSKRSHYTNDEEFNVSAKRPMILTSIENCITRSDLQQRSVMIVFPVIESNKRKPENSLLTDFKKAQPGIFGAILNILVVCLQNFDKVNAVALSRMADATNWVMGAEGALSWPRGEFIALLERNHAEAQLVTLEEWPGYALIVEIAKSSWRGTACELRNMMIKMCATSSAPHSRAELPKSPAQLSRELRRLRQSFKKVDVEIDFIQHAGSDSKKEIALKYIGPTSDASTQDEGNFDNYCEKRIRPEKE